MTNVFKKISLDKVALITGEEKIIPTTADILFARSSLCQ